MNIDTRTQILYAPNFNWLDLKIIWPSKKIEKSIFILLYSDIEMLILSDYYMAFFISHVLSALGSISAQEPHGSRADNICDMKNDML